MKKSLAIIALLLLASCHKPSMEQHVRDNVVQLTGNGNSCTGVQVISPRGVKYILTAAHCDALAENGTIQASLDGQRPRPVRVIEDSPTSDLMLLEGLPDASGIAPAKDIKVHEHAIALTHGQHLTTHRADGEVLEGALSQAVVNPIFSPEEHAACVAKPKQIAVDALVAELCVLSVAEQATTLRTEPGSSGGPVVNESGELIGIVSMGNPSFTYLVTLSDIKSLLSAY